MKLSLENQNGNILTFNDSYPAVTSDSTIDNCLYNKMKKIILLWGCVEEDAEIMLSDGSTKVIREIAQNDSVLSNSNGNAFVSNKYVGPATELCVKIHFNNTSLTLSQNHPVLDNGKWLRASKIKVGDLLTGTDNQKFSVEKVQEIEYQKRLFNLESSGGYFANGIYVGDFSMQNSALDNEQIYKSKITIGSLVNSSTDLLEANLSLSDNNGLLKESDTENIFHQNLCGRLQKIHN